MSKDDPLIFSLKKVIASLEPNKPPAQMVNPNIRLEIFNAIQTNMVPQNVALEVRAASPFFYAKKYSTDLYYSFCLNPILHSPSFSFLDASSAINMRR